jgi:hypothetical protein
MVYNTLYSAFLTIHYFLWLYIYIYNHGRSRKRCSGKILIEKTITYLKWVITYTKNEIPFPLFALSVFRHSHKLHIFLWRLILTFLLQKGWEYALDFPSTYYPKFFSTSMVRRRRWTRNRRFTKYNQFLPIENPDKGRERIIDITCGGWLLPGCPKWFLSVWCVSDTGRLYFRGGVSARNLEGSEWTAVDLPGDLLASRDG